jgi:3-oxoacyl-[acyl-carrier-protein] synthase-3
MRWDSLFIAGLGSSVPAPTSALDAVEAGLFDAERYKRLGYQSVCVDEATPPPDSAAAAATTALRRADLEGRDIAVLLHGSLWYQGLDIWPAASYVAARVGARMAPAYDVQQRCNIGLGAIDLAGALLAADGGNPAGPGRGRAFAALVTTGDRFAPPAVDRWKMHDFNVYGDGGTALVLSARSGFARVVATATAADNTLEGQARGAEPLAAVSCAATTPVDLVARADSYAAETDQTQISIRIGRVMLAARHAALKAAGLTPADITRTVTPASGRLKSDFQVHDLLGVSESATTWDFGRTTGHVGAGDWALGLEHLVATRAVAPGDHVLLFGGGAGYTCTAAVLEILNLPEQT